MKNMKYIYEFIGTFFLVLTVGMTLVNPTDVGMLAPLAIGSVLAVMVYAGAHVSGGHYNPAVSLAAFFRGKLNSKDMIRYWIAQLIAGVLAGYMTIYLNGQPARMAMQIDSMPAFIAEFLFTFALCFVVLNTTTVKQHKGNSYYGFAIGFIVLAGAYAVGTLSSAAFNPAVALGNAVMNLTMWSDLWLFIVANLLGGAFAAWVCKIACKEE